MMLPKAHLTSHSRMSVSRWVITVIIWVMKIFFDCVDHNKLREILKELEIPGHLTWLLRNLYAGQEATVRTRHGRTDWSQIGKGVHQGSILSPCLFNLDAEYIIWNGRLDEAELGPRFQGKISITSDMQMLLLLLSHFSSVWLVWPHRRQPTRLPCSWDSPGKNTEVGCHFLLQCMHAWQVASVMSDSATLWTAAHQPPPSIGFSRHEHWSGLPFYSPDMQMTPP